MFDADRMIFAKTSEQIIDIYVGNKFRIFDKSFDILTFNPHLMGPSYNVHVSLILRSNSTFN